MSAPPNTPSSESRPVPEKKGQKRWRRWALEIGVAVLIYVLIGAWQKSSLLEGIAPDFSAISVTQSGPGSRVDLSDFRGKRVVLHFWATWCGVCRREFGMLRDLSESLPDDTVLLTLVAEENALTLAGFLRENEITYPVLMASPKIVQSFKVGAFPTNYFINSQGGISSSTVGMSTGWAMRARSRFLSD